MFGSRIGKKLRRSIAGVAAVSVGTGESRPAAALPRSPASQTDATGRTVAGGARRNRVHLYAQCWNDAFMLPFFFAHYDDFVDRYVIFDDSSTDESRAILQNHPRVELRDFIRSDPHSFALSEQSLSDQCWKESRDYSDWVIVTDVDEHLFHRNMIGFLADCVDQSITLVPALGFQMISEVEPRQGEILSNNYRHGAPWLQMMKASIFNPRAIDEINFSLGRHSASPSGEVRVPPTDELLLLHYKYLGKDRTYSRHKELFSGLGALDREKGWGHKYSWSQQELTADWENFQKQAVDYREFIDGTETYPLPRWWEVYRSPRAGQMS